MFLRKLFHIAQWFFGPLERTLRLLRVSFGAPDLRPFGLLRRLSSRQESVELGFQGLSISLKISAADDDYDSVRDGSIASMQAEALQTWLSAATREPGGISIDVGSFHGLYACLALSSGCSQVFAFEPNPAVLDMLRQNLETNTSFSKSRWRLFDVALGSETGQVMLYSPYSLPRSSSTRVDPAFLPPRWVGSSAVSCVRLDDLLTDAEKASVNVIKVDVEGGEIRVLIGARETLSKARPVLILEALDGDSRDELVNFLSEFRYADPRRLDADSDSQKNYVFFPKNS